jgi:hypothetical protein
MPSRDALPLLPDGTEYDVAVSALIKTVRRGHELDALYWAAQLSARYPWKTWRVLEVFAAEDVGPANTNALPVVVAGRIAWEHHVKESRGRPPLVLLASVVLTLARSPKSREADDLAETMKHLIEQGWAAQVPDVALDLHTHEGRERMPPEDRLRHWLDEASAIEPDTGTKDWALWIRRWAAQRGHLNAAEVEAQARSWDQAGRLVHGLDGYGSLPLEDR